MFLEVRYFRGDFLKMKIENQVVLRKINKSLQCVIKVESVKQVR